MQFTVPDSAEAFRREVKEFLAARHLAAPLTLVAIAIASSCLPAWRATRIDPVESFRAD